MDWMILPYRRYADFSGRSRRLEYWMFTLFYVLVTIVMFVLAFAVAAMSDGGLEGETGGGTFIIVLLLWLLFALASFIPGIAVQVRRFHDQNLTGWLALLNFLPYLGGFIIMIFMCIDGTRGENSYGPDPKGGFDESVFA